MGPQMGLVTAAHFSLSLSCLTLGSFFHSLYYKMCVCFFSSDEIAVFICSEGDFQMSTNTLCSCFIVKKPFVAMCH